jgi:hypothetical protein
VHPRPREPWMRSYAALGAAVKERLREHDRS